MIFSGLKIKKETETNTRVYCKHYQFELLRDTVAIKVS